MRFEISFKSSASVLISLLLFFVSDSNALAQTCPENLETYPSYGQQEMVLEWTLPPTGATSAEFDIYRGEVLLATVDSSTTSFIDDVSGLEADRHHILYYSLVPSTSTPPCPTLFSRGVYSTGTLFMYEGFETYSSDIELESVGGWSIVDENNPIEDSTWTLTNPLGRPNPPKIDGHESYGNFIVSDSDYGGATNTNPIGSGMSHDIWTPTFNCSTAGQVVLHASIVAQLNDNGNAVFDIDVTVDGGTNWVTAYRRVAPTRTTVEPVATIENADAVFQWLEVDLTPYAAGQASVRIRFRHFEPNWDWWIAVDDLLIDDVLTVTGGVDVLLETEEFTNGIPNDWQIVGLNVASPLDTWNTQDPCARSVTVNNGGVLPYLGGKAVNRLGDFFAIIDSDCNPDPAEDERLITPVIDCTAEEKVYLHLDTEVMPYGGEALSILLSLDGGNSWVLPPIFEAPTSTAPAADNDPIYAEYVIEEPRAAGQSEVAFIFKYTSPGNQWWWAIDNVSITAGEYAAPPPPPTGTTFRRGDCNSDGSFNIADCIYLLASLFSGGPSGECQDACDMNDDGAINIADAITGLSTLFAGGGPLPAPASIICGLDPTGDSLLCDTSSSCP